MIHPHTMTPVWDTDTVWEESFMFMKDENGVAEAPFLYPPIEILKVTSSDGATDYAGTVVANIRDVHKYLLSRKRFMDLTSNQVNHPNDFFYRIHAHYLAGMLIE